MITIVNIENQEWNNSVKKCSTYDVFYLKEYATAFMQEDKSNGIPVLIIYENDDDYAINVVFRRDIAETKIFNEKIEHGKYYDLVSPYGYGGFIGKVSDYEKLNLEYKSYCKENGYICEFVRFELFDNYFRYFQGEVESRTHNVVRDLTIPIDDIWMDFKPKVRKNVKHAIRANLEIIIDESGQYLDEFLKIYYGTMERALAEKEFLFSKQFFETINQMKENYIYFHVKSGEKIISSELVIYGANNCYSYLGGTNSAYFELRPNDFLKYEIIKWASEKGLKKFVLGGGYGSDDGIFQYKACLAPHGIVDFYIGRRIFDENNYSKLVEIRAVENPECIDSSFFPKYRV